MEIFEEFLKEHSSAFIQINSYDYFINHLLQKIFVESPNIVLNIDNILSYSIIFGGIYVSRPAVSTSDEKSARVLYPHEARLRDLTYESVVSIDICVLTKNANKIIKKETHYKVPIIKIPAMLKSCVCNLSYNKQNLHGECENDHGGYFIIKGKERVIINQERAVYNYVFLSKHKDKKFKIVAEFRSMSETTGHSIQSKCFMKASEMDIAFQIPYIKELIPLKVVMAYYEISFSELLYILGPINHKMTKCLYYCYEEFKHINTNIDAIKYILNIEKFSNVKGDDKIGYIQQIFSIELFPHIFIYTREKYIFTLSQLVRKLLYGTFGGRAIDDKDNLCLKRIDSTGYLMYEITRSLWKKTCVELFPNCKRKPTPDMFAPKLVSMSDYLRKCFSKGQWGLPNNVHQRVGVCQLLTRISYSSTISHMRKTSIPAIKNSKKSQIRQLHQSHAGFYCPASTPEGQHAGLIKNVSTTTSISNEISYALVFDIIKTFDTFSRKKQDITNLPICINGHLSGYCLEKDKFVKQFNESYVIQIYETVSINVDMVDYLILIFSDAGRLVRPVLAVDFDKQIVKLSETLRVSDAWQDMVRAGAIKYIDQYSSESSVIANYRGDLKPAATLYQYCEINPAIALSYETTMISFPDHSQAPRNTYASCMSKQAIGWNLNSILSRFDKNMFILNYPQKNVIPTKPAVLLGMDDMPAGINVIVAVYPFHGFNQEDSVVINKSAIDRGLFVSTCFKTISDEEKKHETNIYEKIEIPDPAIVKRKVQFNYDKLDDDGIVPIGTLVCKNDVVIGKVLYRSRKCEENEDYSTAIKQGEEGVVDSVMVTMSVHGKLMVKVKIRTIYVPMIGDKVASNAGQKGTCGMIYRQEDLPFTHLDGIVPDIMINPLCLPSRMTINQVIQMVLGKDTLRTGHTHDSAPFTEFSQSIEKYLEEKRFDSKNEFMYSGISGRLIKAKILIGPTYYYRLKHNVIDKIHARNGGGIQSLTRQPLEGRSKDGGLKFGEMETLVTSGHGAANFLKERLYDVSDPFVIYVCSECKLMVNNPNYCKSCENSDVRKTQLSYASKLLFQYIMSCGTKIKFNVEL